MISTMLKIKENHLIFLALAIIIEIPVILAIVWMTGDYREPRFNIWPVTEWLVNYQGGFVRRGLIGEFLLTISDPISGILPNLYRFVLSSYIFYITIFFAVYALAKIKNNRVLSLPYLFRGVFITWALVPIFIHGKKTFF
jgi:hypothetical protein